MSDFAIFWAIMGFLFFSGKREELDDESED